MSKKPKRSRHRIPTLVPRSDPIDDSYQAEVDASVAKLERRYRHAQRALQLAVERAQRAQADKATHHHHKQLLQEVEARRAELAAIKVLMMPPGSRDSHRRKVRQESGQILVPLGGTARRWRKHNGP